MSDSEYYDILGIGRDADASAIKKAYRKAAVAHHPDKNPGDAAAEEKFKLAAEAYSVLSDPEKRAHYDQFGKQGVGSRGGGGGFDPRDFVGFEDILGDLFGGMFGGGRRRSGASVGRDLRYDLEIDFEEAVHGMETRVQIPRLEACDRCGGDGAESGGIETCTQCRGRGQVAFQQGVFTIARTCNRCGGAGKQITDPCRQCGGEGKTREERTLTVRIPAGVEDGMRLRMSGEGEAGSGGGPPGDLYVVLHVREHAEFERHEQDLYSTRWIGFSQAALGSDVVVPTIDGEDETLGIPAGTQSGERFRIAGRGVPSLRGGSRGDQYVIVRVRTPRKLDDEQRELIEQLAKFEGDDDGEEPGFFDRVRNIFS